MARTYKSLAQSYIRKTHCECLGYSEGSIVHYTHFTYILHTRRTMLRYKGFMMLYKVSAKIKKDNLKDFFEALSDGSIEAQQPDGKTILKAMKEAKMIAKDTLSWYEACYCATPLRHERETVYDKYLEDFHTTLVYEVSDDIEGDLFWDYLEEVYYDDIYTY